MKLTKHSEIIISILQKIEGHEASDAATVERGLLFLLYILQFDKDDQKTMVKLMEKYT